MILIYKWKCSGRMISPAALLGAGDDAAQLIRQKNHRHRAAATQPLLHMAGAQKPRAQIGQ
jgi:hypothetical protein